MNAIPEALVHIFILGLAVEFGLMPIIRAWMKSIDPTWGEPDVYAKRYEK